MKGDIFKADANGEIVNCGQGGGVGFSVEPISIDSALNAVTKGTLPVKATLDDGSAPTFWANGLNCYWTRRPFAKLKLSNCTAGSFYLVTVLEDLAEGLAALNNSQSVLAEETIFDSGLVQITGNSQTYAFGFGQTAVNTLYGTTGPSFWDVRKYKGVLLHVFPANVNLNAASFILETSLQQSAAEGSGGNVPTGPAYELRTAGISIPSATGVGGGIFMAPGNSNGNASMVDSAHLNFSWKPAFVRIRYTTGASAPTYYTAGGYRVVLTGLLS